MKLNFKGNCKFPLILIGVVFVLHFNFVECQNESNRGGVGPGHNPSHSNNNNNNAQSSEPHSELSDLATELLNSVTSKAQSVDEWLFSEDLFPGHVIPQNINHADAIKLFANLLEDNDVISEAYDRYRVQFTKEADPADDTKLETRKFNFRENLHGIFQHNLQADSGKFRFQLGVNFFADMAREEMSHFLGGKNKLPVHPKNNNGGNPFAPLPPPPHHIPPNVAPPTADTHFPLTFDLRDYNFISPVKNQKRCGSCVFFSHAGLMEGLYAAKTNGTIINVSEQMMLDCAHKIHGYENNEGCDGNIMEDTGRFLVEHGITHEHLYKYQAKQANCSKAGKEIIAQLKEYHALDPTPEAFKHVLVNLKAPIATAFYVFPQFMFYRAGVFDWCMPPNGMTGGHAVLIVGYGRFFDIEYWLVKNSWGEKWGERGYVKYVIGSNFCNFERWGFTGTLA